MTLLLLLSLPPPLYLEKCFEIGNIVNLYYLCFLSGVEEIISLERALQGLFDGELECLHIDLIETLPPLVSDRSIEAIPGSLSGLEDVVGVGKESDMQDIIVTGVFQKDHDPSGSPISL